MAEKKAALLPLFAVSVEKDKKKQQLARAAPPFLPGVLNVIMWAFLNAGCFAFAVAYVLIVNSISHPPSWLLPAPDPEPATEMLTDAEVHIVLVAGMLWCVCAVAQAAAGALALALPRRRLLLAYAALLATAAGHCTWALLHIMLVVAAGDPVGGVISMRGAAISIAGAVDILCFLRLFLRVEGRGGVAEEGRTTVTDLRRLRPN